MQALSGLAHADSRALYVSGEESAAQIALRARRLGTESPHVLVQASTELEAVEDTIDAERPIAVVVDSVQTVRCADIDSVAGSVGQIRAVASRLIERAKREGITLFLIGHVTKEGTLAGPKVLEHLVDTVLSFEGDASGAFRARPLGRRTASARRTRSACSRCSRTASARFRIRARSSSAERPRSRGGIRGGARPREGTRPLPRSRCRRSSRPAVYGSARRLVSSGVDGEPPRDPARGARPERPTSTCSTRTSSPAIAGGARVVRARRSISRSRWPSSRASASARCRQAHRLRRGRARGRSSRRPARRAPPDRSKQARLQPRDPPRGNLDRLNATHRRGRAHRRREPRGGAGCDHPLVIGDGRPRPRRVHPSAHSSLDEFMNRRWPPRTAERRSMCANRLADARARGAGAAFMRALDARRIHEPQRAAKGHGEKGCWARVDFADARARSAVSALLKLPSAARCELCGSISRRSDGCAHWMLDELKNRRGRRGPRRGDHWARADFADARARSAVSALLKLPLCGPLRALRFNFSSFGWLRALDARRIEKPQRAAEDRGEEIIGRAQTLRTRARGAPCPRC